MDGCIAGVVDVGEVFTILTPSFQNNLCSLTLNDIQLDAKSIEQLASAVTNCFGLGRLDWIVARV